MSDEEDKMEVSFSVEGDILVISDENGTELQAQFKRSTREAFNEYFSANGEAYPVHIRQSVAAYFTEVFGE